MHRSLSKKIYNGNDVTVPGIWQVTIPFEQAMMWAVREYRIFLQSFHEGAKRIMDELKGSMFSDQKRFKNSSVFRLQENIRPSAKAATQMMTLAHDGHHLLHIGHCWNKRVHVQLRQHCYLALIQIFNYRRPSLNQLERFLAPAPESRIALATGFVAAQIYGGIIEQASYTRLTMANSKSNRFPSGQPRRCYRHRRRRCRRCQQRRRIGSRFAIGHEVFVDLHDS